MSLGRLLVLVGALLLVTGLVILVIERTGIHAGHLPGDIDIRGKYGTFYFPIASCILLSVLISAVLWVIQRLR